MLSEFLVPRRMVMGENAVESVPIELKGFKKANPLIVTDAGVAKAGILNRLLSPLDSAGIRHGSSQMLSLTLRSRSSKKGIRCAGREITISSLLWVGEARLMRPKQ
jgi:alcohol dehydrogenase class IV